MGTYLGNGYALWKPTFTLDGTTKIFQTALMSKNEDDSTAQEHDAYMRLAFTTTGAPFIASAMYIGYTLARSEAYVMAAGVLTYWLNETAIVGTKSGSSGTPINTSVIVKKETNIVGKMYRGRIMLPNMTVAENNINQAGIIDSTGLGVIQGQYDIAYAAWESATCTPVLGHTSSEVLPTVINTLTVTPKVGSMPHRIRGF